MAWVEKIGEKYKLRTYVVRPSDGKRVKKSKTWIPPQGLSEKKLKEKLNEAVYKFENECNNCPNIDRRITLSDFIDNIWKADYEVLHLKPTTLRCYIDMLNVFKSYFGNKKLCEITQFDIHKFYSYLESDGIRRDVKYRAKEDIGEAIKILGLNKTKFAEKSGIAVNTLNSICRGNNTTLSCAEKIASALCRRKNDLFCAVERDNLADTTILKYHNVISSVMHRAFNLDLIDRNPCDKISAPSVIRSRMNILNENELSALFKALDNEDIEFKTIVMLALYSGARRGEICALNWADFNENNMTLRIDKSISYVPRKGLVEGPTKTNNIRTISIPNDIADLLLKWREEQNKKRIMFGDLWRESGKIFTSEYGEIKHPDVVTKHFKKIVKSNAEIPNEIHFHTLRHQCASMLINVGTNVAIIAERLGHADTSTTFKNYVKGLDASDREASNSLELCFKQIKNMNE